ncbi:hypothetical protein V5799_014540 [Amblyomma americanum]|uniref:Uncharacterized protein n=1 Tax=Amblyomma americanum TaxID=6943 RepID=A0AAQ4E2R0_AMBAM
MVLEFSAIFCYSPELVLGNRFSILALCKLLEHGIQTNDSRLVDISVKGDRVFNMNEGIRTRSKAATNPDQWTEIPVLVKIYKLMIHELSNCLDHAMMQKEEDDSEDEEWEDEGDMDGDGAQHIMSHFAPASDYAGYDLDGQDDSDDPDAAADPISRMDLQSCLVQFLRGLSQQPFYSKFSEHHTAQELQVLQNAGVLA